MTDIGRTCGGLLGVVFIVLACTSVGQASVAAKVKVDGNGGEFSAPTPEKLSLCPHGGGSKLMEITHTDVKFGVHPDESIPVGQHVEHEAEIRVRSSAIDVWVC